MSRYVLVPATGADSDEPVFAMALTVARRLPAHLEFLHVRLNVQETLAAMASAWRFEIIANGNGCWCRPIPPPRCRRPNGEWRPATNRRGWPRTGVRPTLWWLGAPITGKRLTWVCSRLR